MKIHYLPHKQINKEKWNAAVDRAANGQIYAYAWYLDCVADDNWDALVTEDYTYIMPLPWNAKWLGVKQIYQPLFTQQLGVFGAEAPSEEIVYTFLQAIPKKFRYILLQLNEANTVNHLKNFEVKTRTNMLLDLSSSYEEIHSNFRKSLRRRIKKGEKELSFAVNRVNAKDLVIYYQKYLNQKVGLSDKSYQIILKLIKTTLKVKKGNIYSAHFADGSFGAGIFFAESHNRIVQLFGPSSPAGKKANANHFLLNAIIKKYAASGKTLDFEGSDIPSIADFFRGFHPDEVAYYQIIRDEFPFWIKGLRACLKI